MNKALLEPGTIPAAEEHLVDGALHEYELLGATGEEPAETSPGVDTPAVSHLADETGGEYALEEWFGPDTEEGGRPLPWPCAQCGAYDADEEGGLCDTCRAELWDPSNRPTPPVYEEVAAVMSSPYETETVVFC